MLVSEDSTSASSVWSMKIGKISILSLTGRVCVDRQNKIHNSSSFLREAISVSTAPLEASFQPPTKRNQRHFAMEAFVLTLCLASSISWKRERLYRKLPVEKFFFHVEKMQLMVFSKTINGVFFSDLFSKFFLNFLEGKISGKLANQIQVVTNKLTGNGYEVINGGLGWPNSFIHSWEKAYWNRIIRTKVCFSIRAAKVRQKFFTEMLTYQ